MTDTTKFHQPYASKGLVDGQVRSGLNDSEKAAYDELHKTVETWGLDNEMREWCNEGTLCRYLRARSWDASKAATMLDATVKWRREAKPNLINYEKVKGQADSLANIVWGFDSVGHVLMYLRVTRDPPGTAQEKLDFVIHNIEESTRMMERHSHFFKGVERLTYIVDLKGFTMQNSSRDMQVSKQWTHILANHCPERLHKAYLLNYPGVFKFFWMALKPFLDVVTTSKVYWVNHTTHLARQQYFKDEGIDPDWFEEEYGGNLPVCNTMNCVSKPGYKSFFNLIPPVYSPYNWAMIAGVASVISCAKVLPVEITIQAGEDFMTSRSDDAISDAGSEDDEVREIWNSIHDTAQKKRLELEEITVEEPAVCVRRPAGDLRLVPVDSTTLAGTVKRKAAPQDANVNHLALYHDGVPLSDTVNVFPLVRKKDTVIELRVEQDGQCCVLA